MACKGTKCYCIKLLNGRFLPMAFYSGADADADAENKADWRPRHLSALGDHCAGSWATNHFPSGMDGLGICAS
jgi:hypothetical protein